MAKRKTIKQMAVEALENWRHKNTAEVIAERVARIMDQHAEELIMAVLGFKKGCWGPGYELDHYHESAMRDAIRAWAAEAAEQWMAAHKAEIVSEVAPSLIRAMVSRYRNVAKEEIGRVVDEAACDAATKFARAAIAEIFATEDMEITERDMMRLFEVAN